MWVHCNTIVLATAAPLPSFCRWECALLVADCLAVERDDPTSRRQTRNLRYLMKCEEVETTSDWRQWIQQTRRHFRLLRSPTHAVNGIRSKWHTKYVDIPCSQLLLSTFSYLYSTTLRLRGNTRILCEKIKRIDWKTKVTVLLFYAI